MQRFVGEMEEETPNKQPCTLSSILLDILHTITILSQIVSLSVEGNSTSFSPHLCLSVANTFIPCSPLRISHWNTESVSQMPLCWVGGEHTRNT